jgi:hypothetical protein
MGIGSQSVEFIRQFFRQSEFHRPPYTPANAYGGISTNAPYFSYGMSSGSLQGITDYLRVDSDLVGRYIDAEDMDDSPLVACVTGDTLVRTLERGNVSIEALAQMYSQGEKFKILAFDTQSQEFVIADAHHPRKTKTDKVIEIGFNDGSVLRCTPDHKIMLWDQTYKEAGTLSIGESVICSYESHRVANYVVSIRDAGIEDVYDLTTDVYHNFIANNIVVHNSALDIYADDSCIVNTESGKSVWVECEDEDIREELDHLLHKTLLIEERVWGDIRQLCKYGNLLIEQVVKDRVGVIAINSLPPPTIRRIEVPKQIGQDPNQPQEEIHWDTLGYIYDPRGVFKINTKQFIDELKYRVTGEMSSGDKPMGVQVFEGWEVVHMRLMGKSPHSIYGFSITEPARWIFKRLLLLEDSIILHRLSRAPSRFAFYVDVSGVPPNETGAYLNRVKQGLKKQKFVNPNQSQKLDQKYHVLNSEDDFILPVRDGKESTRVETLQGPIYDHIEDIKFFENKLFAALKVPKPFLTYEESTAKSHLSAEDARFARTILRVQREFRNGMKKICKTHLAAKGINPESIDFDVCMTMPSAIFELSQLEVRAAELELASKYDGWANKYWIKTHVLGWSDDQIRESDPQFNSDKEGMPEPTPSSGAIAKALAGRGERKSSSSDSAPPSGDDTKVVATDAETVGSQVASQQSGSNVILSAVRRNTEKLLERIENLHNKTSDKKWNEIKETLKDIRHTIERK